MPQRSGVKELRTYYKETKPARPQSGSTSCDRLPKQRHGIPSFERSSSGFLVNPITAHPLPVTFALSVAAFSLLLRWCLCSSTHTDRGSVGVAIPHHLSVM
ncbi:hypothetical protein BO83DRAFT_375147 [Aspergillus eucalypticola CBS 122712]|uniref:Uncharacterized protein n=1 Tax=Aspergillus eucalypticola (strain CBS 122712 / IBT 29274) TaxID=1448314 RepID=A0A317WC63_ASPEC|nr:uncharacterized protein BO83DRAFT_375147 [Aspergillus eucalypticola CBS 122712]PWY82782.1 hypothetical protein BO83DRAFT_375147 [Aspergillus eucalypticola CBS 122712]